MNTLARQTLPATIATRKSATARHQPSGPAAISPPVLRKAACSCGGGCPKCQTAGHGLPVSQPGDPFELDADRLARSALSSHEALPAPAPASPIGEPLPSHARAFLEPRFNADLSAVRLHSGREAESAADSLNASAFSVGQDVFFGANTHAPHTPSGAALLAHELAHTVQAQSGPARVSRQPKDAAPAASTPDPKTPAADAAKPSPDAAFGSPRVIWDIFDAVIIKAPKRWQDAYEAAKGTHEDILFEPKLGYDLIYKQVMAALNLMYAGVYSGTSPYKPTFSNGLKMAESMSGVADTYINLASLALRLDLKKYLTTDLKDQAIANLGWTILYGLAIQGIAVGINAGSKDDLDFTSVLGLAVKDFTAAPLGMARPSIIANIPDPRWSSYPFGSSPGDFGVKLGGVGDDTKPYSFSLNVGFNIAGMRDLYPKKEEDKPKYKGFELYPYFGMRHTWAKPPDSLDPNAPLSPATALDPNVKDFYLAGVFFGDRGVYTMLEGGVKRLPGSGEVAETYFRTGLAFRDLGPFTTLTASGEFDKRPLDSGARQRINAATSISLVDNKTWQAAVGGSLGYLLPSGDAPAVFDYSGQIGLYYKYQREKKDPLKTGFDISASYRTQDPFVATSPQLTSLKGSMSLFDFFKFSIEYHNISGPGLDTKLPTNDTRFMVYPGPGMFSF